MGNVCTVHLLNRKCSRCGGHDTYQRGYNHTQWYREVDASGKWTGNWLCCSCYGKEYRAKRKKDIEMGRRILIMRKNLM